jgi:transcription initiation factor IIE alpha subunit
MNFPKKQIIKRLIREDSPLLKSLDEKEKQIVSLINSDITHEQIRQEMGMNKSSLDRAIQAIHKKLHVHYASSPKSRSKNETSYRPAWDKPYTGEKIP